MKTRFFFNLRVVLTFIALLTGGNALTARGQSAQPVIKDVAVKLDEYGRAGGCDHSARLDNLAIQLLEHSNLDGYVVTYGPQGDGSGSGKVLLEIIKDYLVNMRGIDESRLKMIYGGRNSDLKEPRTELWLAPRGAPAPEPTRYENNIATFKGKFDEYEGWDSIALGEGTGPPVPGVTTASFVDMLNQQKQTRAYLVAYNGTEAAPGAWRRIAQLETESLQGLGLDPGRLKVIYGGTAGGKESKIELWITAADAPPPVKDAGAEPAPEKTVQIGSFNDYDLDNEHSERWVFKGFLDVLRSGKDLRACIIVRLGVLPSESDAEETTAASANDSLDTSPALDLPPPPDLARLVEKWRSELSGTYKIPAQQFVVLFVPQEKIMGNALETWIVPAGAALPDPHARPADEAESEPPSDDKAPPKKPVK